MNNPAFTRAISGKRFNPEKVADEVIKNGDWVERAIAGLDADTATLKYRCEKGLREVRP